MDYFLLTLKRYADFNGRSRRKEYWMFTLFIIIFYIVGIILTQFSIMIGVTLTIIFLIAMIIPSFAVSVRRMHDVGKSGWFVLIPIYNFILTLTPGQVGPNEYGPDPKGGDVEIDLVEHIN